MGEALQDPGRPVTPAQAALTRPSLTTQIFWLLFAKVVGFALAFIAPLLVVRALDQRAFGLYKQAFQIVGNATPILTLWFYMNVFYFLPRRPEKGPKVVLNVLIVHLAVALAGLGVLLAWPGVLAVFVGNSDLAPYAPVLGAILCSTALGYFLEVVATAGQDVKYSTAFIVLSQLTRSVAMCVAAVLFGTLEALLYASVLQGILQSAVLLWYLQRRYPGFVGRPDWPLMREQLAYALPLGIAALGVFVQTDAHLYFVAHWFSPAEYAIYAVGCFQIPLLGILRESVNAVLIPRISYLQQQDAWRDVVLLLSAGMRKLAFVYWPAAVLLIVTAGDIIQLLYTSRYEASTPIFMVNLLAIPTLILISDPVTRAYTAHIGFLIKVRLAAAILLIPALYIGIQYFGMQGAATVAVAVIAAERLIVMRKVTRILKMSHRDLPLFADVFKLALAAVCAGAVASAALQLLDGSTAAVRLAGAATVFSAVYLASVIALRIPTPEETALVRRKMMHIGRLLRLA